MKRIHWWMYLRWSDLYDFAPQWRWLERLIDLPRYWHWEKAWPLGSWE